MSLGAFVAKLLGLAKPGDPLGRRGEKLAARYLRTTLGMRILRRNVLVPGGELDLVALDGDDLVFVEVRTRATEAFGTPESTIRSQKRKRILHAARYFIRTRRLGRFVPRFDVVAVVWPAGGEPVIRYQRNAFGFPRP